MANNTIAIDARPLTRKISGIRRYTEELLKILLEDKNTRWLLYTDRVIEGRHWLAEKENVEILVAPHRWGARFLWPLYSTWWLYRHKPDIYWSPRHHLPVSSPKSTKLFVSIHDLVWMESRETMPVLAWVSEWLWTKHSIAKADSILAVSDTTSRKIKEYFNVRKALIFTITNGYNPPGFSNRPEVLNSVTIGDFFLAVGTHEPRKNYAVLIAAYSHYLNMGGRKALLIVGNKGWGKPVEQIVKALAKAGERILVLKNINDN
jgi:glycosyltransferase involved in cell wall biosynthesis